MVSLVDDTGLVVPLATQISRIVSLVPSLTEALALSCPEKLVAATDWCTHPAGLAVARVGGTKTPDLEAIAALGPDLVVANAEENRPPDLDVLRAQGIAVWVTDIRTVDQALVIYRQAASRRWSHRHHVVGPGAGLVVEPACRS